MTVRGSDSGEVGRAARGALGDRPRLPGDRHVSQHRWYRTVVFGAGLVSLLVLLLEYGFDGRLGPGWLLVGLAVLSAAGFVATRIAGMLDWRDRVYRHGHRVDLVFVGFAAALPAVAEGLGHARAEDVLLPSLHSYLLLMLGLSIVRANRFLTDLGAVNPARLLVIGFLLVILLGTVLLLLPVSTTEKMNYAPNYLWPTVVNGLFMATSAVCVTGLTVYPLEEFYTPFGQFVLLCLIQIGGLSVTIFGAVAGLFLGQTLSLRSAVALSSLSGVESAQQVGRMARFIVITTLAIEAVGAVLIMGMWPAEWSFSRRAWYSVFTSVSAFCNAGFMLDPSSLMNYGHAWQTYLVVAPLILLGGIGYPVLAGLNGFLLGRAGEMWRGRLHAASVVAPRRRVRLDLHSRVVLWCTLACTLTGTVGLFVAETQWLSGWSEWGGRRDMVTLTDQPVPPLAQMELWDRALHCLFLTIVSRTAGFANVPTGEGEIGHASMTLLIVLMFVGGAPASCAGGVKVTTLFVLMAALLAALRDRDEVDAFRREIPQLLVRRAGALLLLYLSVQLVVLFLLFNTEQQTFGSLVFEAVSACGTVGLSTGITPTLSNPGKFILVVGMIAGRVGPLTILLALPRKPQRVRYQYAKEPILLG